MGSDNDDASGKRKGRKVWLFVKNASMAMIIFTFFLTVILVLDAYKFVSIRVSNASTSYCVEVSPLCFMTWTDFISCCLGVLSQTLLHMLCISAITARKIRS